MFINGKPLIERSECIGRGGGEKPYGAYITKEWFDDFKGGDVTIAVKSFLRYNDKRSTKPSERVPQGRISVHLEEQKLPPMGDDLVRKSATVVPMTCSEWQAAQASESDEDKDADHMFRWDGKFVPNPDVHGAWKVVAEVPEFSEFDPAKPRKPKKPAFTALAFEDAGRTSAPTFVWSGDHLMDLERYQALKIVPRTIDGNAYLFVESGGFRDKNPAGWESSWLVMKRN